MDTDIGRLTMVNKEKAAEEICPKCHATHQPWVKECPNCGVLFNKLKSSTSGTHRDVHPVPTPPPTAGRQRISNELEKRKKLCGILIFLCVLGVGFYCLYVACFESRVQAGGFQAQLDEFCSQEISKRHSDHVAEGEDPFRTGKVLVVSQKQQVTLMSVRTGRPYTMVLPQEIHPAWYKLNRKTRAKNPSDIDTLIRVHKVIGKTRRYGKLKTKIFSAHKIVLDVYDWRNQTFIGTKVFDPGEGSMFMTEEDYDAILESVSDKAIAKYIQSMDIQPSETM